jgi:dimethylamine/trimethylamine dehydrogenase
MARNPNHDILFQPIQIGPKTLRNRFYQVPHCTGFGSVKPYSQARHRSLKAEGGWAAVCTEYAPISADSDDMPYFSAAFWDEDDVEILRVMCQEVHEHGSLAGIELHHGGVHSERGESRWPAVAPSQIATDKLRGNFAPEAPKVMELEDIRRIQEEWAKAALRAREAGFDIIYVYGGHSYLPMQFLSTFYNKRTDEYGGSFANRARFWLETLDAVRQAVGKDCAIANRISIDALGPAGVKVEEGLEFIRLADKLVDLWDVNVGSINEWSVDSGSSRFYKSGYQLEWSGQARKATRKPIVGVGRLTNPDQMAEILASGAWDIIGAARPSIADPFLPQKIDEGRLDEIRECMGNNSCIARGNSGNHLGCAQNATAGEEYRRGWHPERFTRARNADHDVLVVGAGPAGMECAIVLGKRGMRRVHLVDAEPEIGGTMRWIPRLPGLGEWKRFVDWRKIQLSKLPNVEVHNGVRLTAKAVRDYGAELVVIATGGRWAVDGLNAVTHEPIRGADALRPHVLTPEQVMLDGKRPPGGRVVVYDVEGYFMAPGIAEKLAEEGFKVELITVLDQISPYSDETLEGPQLRQHLHDLGITMRRAVLLDQIHEGGVVCSSFGERIEVQTDGVVLVTQRLSNEELYLQLRAMDSALNAAGVEGLYRIGDCVAPRMLPEVIFDGHRLGREIDSENPAVPLPYLRERIVPARSTAESILSHA